ncbi:VOC family protein [Candidatus Bipolaricaulota bacterium]|nr:VOC family protein [Candidatus Bipolaricaulota bacterium]
MSNGEVTRVHHIGVTVEDAQQTIDDWTEMLDCKGKVVDIPENDLRIGVLEVAGVTFFFNEITDPDKKESSLQELEDVDLPFDFSGHTIINSKGEGISHIALETTDLDYHVNKAEQAGLEVQREEHKDSLEGKCNFIDPEDATLPLEFMQPVEGRENPLE